MNRYLCISSKKVNNKYDHMLCKDPTPHFKVVDNYFLDLHAQHNKKNYKRINKKNISNILKFKETLKIIDRIV